MKRLQSVLCALALAIALSPTVLAGDIHGGSAPGDIHGAPGDIHGIKGDIYGIYGILISSIFGNIYGI